MKIDMNLPKDERILLAAEQVFTMYGFERATLDEMIALADVGKGTVYKYFGNKEGLFYRLVSDKNKPFIEKLQAAVDGQTDFAAKLKAFFITMVEFYSENKNLWQIIYFEMMGENNGCTVRNVGGTYQVVPRYSQIAVSDEIKERIMRYFNLVHAGYSILDAMVNAEYEKGTLKESCDIRMSTTHLFFGVAMGIFHYSSEVADTLSYEDCADIIVDRYLNGERAK